jgi:methionyl-tRNA formyltransferase
LRFILKLKVVFLGTPEFSVPTLEVLAAHPKIEIVKVISMPDRPAGRGHQLKSPEVIEYCKQHKIAFAQSENINKDQTLIAEITQAKPDVMLVLAFAQFLNDTWLNMAQLGCFNIHTSLLPKYRGAAPIQYALLNGDTSTGVSIQKMVKKMDAGDLVLSHPVTISDWEIGGLLYTRLKFQAALSTYDFFNLILNNQLKFTAQDESQISFAPSLTKEQGAIDFNSSTFNSIHNQLRALDPWPGTYTEIANKRVKVFAVEKTNNPKLKPAEVKSQDGMLFIGCKDTTLRITDLQMEGKKRCSDIEFLRGFREELKLTGNKG